MKYNEVRRTLREKMKEIEKLQSGTNTSTVCIVYSNMFIDTNTSTKCTVNSNMFMYFHCISNMRI